MQDIGKLLQIVWKTLKDFINIMYIIYLYIYTIICILNLLLPAQSKILKQNKYLVKKEGKMKFFQQQGGEITQVMQAMKFPEMLSRLLIRSNAQRYVTNTRGGQVREERI